MFKIARNSSSSDLRTSVSVTVSLVTIALGALITPQVILRSFTRADANSVLFVALGVGLAVFALTCAAVNRVTQLTPRRTTHQLATRFIGTWAGLFVGAAQIMLYGLLVLIGVELVVISINGIVALGVWSRLCTVALILLFAVPTLLSATGQGLWWPRLLAFLGVGGLIAVLGWGLVQELRGAVDFAAILEARQDALRSDVELVHSFPHIESILGACVPAAIALNVSERVMAVPERRRVLIKRILTAQIPMLVLILVTMYFVIKLQLPGRRNGMPALSIASAFFGDAGRIVIAILFAFTGFAVVVAAYRQLPRVLRELAINGLLSRRLVAQDAAVPRRLMVLLIAIVLAVIAWVLDSTRSFAMVFIVVSSFKGFMLALAITARSTTILNDSIDAQERSLAKRTRWTYRLFAAVMMSIIVMVLVVEPLWFIAALLSLTVPVLYMLVYRRGVGRISKVLASDDALAGRVIPTRVHSFVLVERVDLPTLKALDWARASRGSSLQAICVDLDPVRTRQLRKDWAARKLPVALTIVGTPAGAARGPVIEFVRAFRSTHPNDVVMVYYPRVISTGSWERFFIRHTTPKVISELELEPGVMVTKVPYRMDSVEEFDDALVSGISPVRPALDQHVESK